MKRTAYITAVYVVPDREGFKNLARVTLSLRSPDGRILQFEDNERLSTEDAKARADAIREGLS